MRSDRDLGARSLSAAGPDAAAFARLAGAVLGDPRPAGGRREGGAAVGSRLGTPAWGETALEARLAGLLGRRHWTLVSGGCGEMAMDASLGGQWADGRGDQPRKAVRNPTR